MRVYTHPYTNALLRPLYSTASKLISHTEYMYGLYAGMPETQQRSKEAVGCLQTALTCADMSPEMAIEVKKVSLSPSVSVSVSVPVSVWDF